MALPLYALLDYREDLLDAVDAQPVSEGTQLVQLHKPDLHTKEGMLVRNLTRVARLEAENECCLITEEGVTLPPQAAHGYSNKLPGQYIFIATFNRLMTAPVLRLECKWPQLHAFHGSGCLKLVLEFHFNDTEVSGIENFQVHEQVQHLGTARDEITFTAHGATCQGFNNMTKLKQTIGPHNQRVLDALLPELRSLVNPDTPRQIRLRFRERIDRIDAAMGTLLPYIVGGEWYKLATLSLPEWSALLPLRPERTTLSLMDADATWPLVPLECGDTYPTINQASVELYESARMAHLEQEIALREWASKPHRGILYHIGGAIVMAVRFNSFRKLGGRGGVIKFDLPDRLQAQLSWEDPMTDKHFSASGTRCTLPLRLPAYDALFLITKATDALRAACLPTTESDPRFYADVTLKPRMSKFTLKSQLQTALNLRHPHASRWDPIILNQDHALEEVDLALKRATDFETPSGDTAVSDVPLSDVPLSERMAALEVAPSDLAAVESAVEEAYQRMLNWRQWNEEQLQALKSVRKAVGGIILITGPAGTGKTLVLQAMTVFFYRIGLHVLVLAPANSNCNDFMRKQAQLFPDVPATRIFPSSTDFKPKDLANRTGHPNGAGNAQESDTADDSTVSLFDLEMVRADLKSSGEKSSAAAQFGLAAQVLAAARAGTYIGQKNDLINKVERDAWEALQGCVLTSDAGTFDFCDAQSLLVYEHSYNACKAHFVALSRLIITTTGNVRTGDIINNWALDKHDLKCQGIVIILDEACKDREIDSLSALLWPSWRNKITGMVMLGDERQLEPTNTCAKGNVVFNPFSDRLNIPFLTRLKREGFPCTELVEQHRMSVHISQWPSNNFYPPGMRDGPGTGQTLLKKQPGLHACMVEILRSVGTIIPARLSASQQDKFVRTHYLEVHGRRDNSKLSAVVREHIKLFFDHCFWPLKTYYGNKTDENVMIICAYKEARKTWQEAASYLQRKYQIPNAQMPRILTIDSSQGTEAPVTFIDCSVQRYRPDRKYGDIGFVDDDKRMNVAFTRAQEVRYILGGSCNVRQRPLHMPETPAYVRHREEIKEVTLVKNKMIQDEVAWIGDLRKREVNLPISFAAEACH